jgi:hypothetical protein
LHSLSVAARKADPEGIAFAGESEKLARLEHRDIGLMQPVSLFPLKR